MRFLWPWSFAVLAVIPLLILLFVWRQRRRRRFAVRYSSLSLVRAALPGQSRLRRYLPMALLFLALASLGVALARPVRTMRVPASRATIMLTIDVSGSMRQNDIQPTRLLAAEQAALKFIDRQKSSNQIGIVAFSGFAELVQEPTTDGEKLTRAIRSLTTGRRTAIGEGIITSLETIGDYDKTGGAQLAPTGQGEYRPDIIVLLTDGVSNAGMDPLEAAGQARDNQVRIYAIGYGTKNGTMGRFRGGGGGPGGRNGPFGMNFGIDEKALQDIAAMTGGKYYTANSADELQQVFDSLPTVLITREETLEMSVIFAALAALLVTGGVLLSQLWHPLP